MLKCDIYTNTISFIYNIKLTSQQTRTPSTLHLLRINITTNKKNKNHHHLTFNIINITTNKKNKNHHNLTFTLQQTKKNKNHHNLTLSLSITLYLLRNEW
jgi:hypothetical protein